MSDVASTDSSATQKPSEVAVAVVDAPTALTGAPHRIDTATLVTLLTEALTVLTIYAEVAVPVPSYRGQPLSTHAPRELVERIHRAIGV